MKIDPKMLREMMERQGDISDPAPYRTRRDEAILKQRQTELVAGQATNGNGAHSKEVEIVATGDRSEAATNTAETE